MKRIIATLALLAALCHSQNEYGIDLNGALLSANNLSDVTSVATARTNLGVQPASSILTAIAGATSGTGFLRLSSGTPSLDATTYEPYSAILATLDGLGNSAGFLANNGSGGLTYATSIPASSVSGVSGGNVVVGTGTGVAGSSNLTWSNSTGLTITPSAFTGINFNVLAGYSGFGCWYGPNLAGVTETLNNFSIAAMVDGTQLNLNAASGTSSYGGDNSVNIRINNGTPLIHTVSSGNTLAGTTTLSALGAGFVQTNSSGVVSSSVPTAGQLTSILGSVPAGDVVIGNGSSGYTYNAGLQSSGGSLAATGQISSKLVGAGSGAGILAGPSSNPGYGLSVTGAGTDGGNWDIQGGFAGNALKFRAVNDANNAANEFLSVTRSGYSITGVTVPLLTVSGAATLSGGASITGGTSAAASGTWLETICEYKNSSGGYITLTSNTAQNVDSLSLTAGVYNVRANINITATSATIALGAAWKGGVTSSSNSVPADGSEVYGLAPPFTSASGYFSIVVPDKQIILRSSGKVFSTLLGTFTGGTINAAGGLCATRIQ
jgi:hypothetical protein